MNRPEVKICGIRRPEDAELAVSLGADYLGFIFYNESPRGIDLAGYRAAVNRVSGAGVRRVYVQVRPEPEELEVAAREGFDFFQVHFSIGDDLSCVESWSKTVSPHRLWLAPRIAPDEDFPRELLPYADTILVDTYRKDRFGGTGEVGDWSRFREWTAMDSEKRWVLSGGLKPENLTRAIEESGASVVDLSSGIEAAPGKKDPERMTALFSVLRTDL